ncbi:hypothetical protein [Cellulomonas denverensis]|uniref:hypothetical protein n=1 Tax=Cellulomonas denverensis TaxID=264297 RepID=UPI0035EBF2A7
MPDELYLRWTPPNCSFASPTLTCTWSDARAGSLTTFAVPIAVRDGLPIGTVIPLEAPEVSYTSPYEAPGQTSHWTASVVGAPYQLTVTGVGVVPTQPPTGSPTTTPPATASPTTAPPATTSPADPPTTGAAPAPAPEAPVTITAGGLAVTGADLAIGAAVGVLLIGLGVTVVLIRRTRPERR